MSELIERAKRAYNVARNVNGHAQDIAIAAVVEEVFDWLATPNLEVRDHGEWQIGSHDTPEDEVLGIWEAMITQARMEAGISAPSAPNPPA